MPRFPWPKKKPKEDKKDKNKEGSGDESTVDLRSVDGTLRKLGEKDLLLEVSSGRILQFRLLPKTQFRNPEGATVRDSLLHSGDQLTVQVSADDEETAYRVIRLREANEEERTSAAKSVDMARVVKPTKVDLGEAPIRAGGARPDDSHKSGEENRPPPEGQPAPGSRRPDDDSPRPASSPDEQLVESARDAAAAYMRDVPNYVVEQVTTRYSGRRIPPTWQVLDEVTAELAVVEGKEQYRNIRINGQPANVPIEKTGAWSTGEFATTLNDVMSPSVNAHFKRRGDEQLGTRPVVVYDINVSKDDSHWILVTPAGQKYTAPFTGSVWIDKATRQVLRIVEVADTRGLPFDKTETTVEFGFVRLDLGLYLLPVESENVGCLASSSACSKNVISFRKYRKFNAESNITFDKFSPSK